MTFRYLDHTADVGCEVTGKTRRELYENGAKALFSLVVAPHKVEEREEINLTVSGIDEVDLWITYLRELLCLANVRGFIGRSVKVTSCRGRQISAVVRGEKLDFVRHRPVREVKAVTYHRAEVKKTPQGWCGRFICDV